MSESEKSRREFLKITGLAAGAALVSPSSARAHAAMVASHVESASAQNEPSVADCTLHIKESPIEIAPKRIISAASYNGQFPGPLLRFKEGQQVPALIIYGIVSWGLLAPQQRRLVQLAPQTAPVVLGLNTSFTYLGVTVAGIVGALGIPVFGAHHLGYLGASIVAIALLIAQMATWRISAASMVQQTDKLATA